MPEHYIEFDEERRRRLEQYDLPGFREKVRNYAVELVQFHAGNGCTCTVLETITGGFHVCVFLDVMVDREAKKWVLRVPIPWKHAENLLDEKFRSEIATMKYISANTKLPIPQIIAFGFLNGLHPGGDRFMLMECGRGTMLADGLPQLSNIPDTKRDIFYSSLCDILLQLWTLPFDRIGSIRLDENGEPDASNLTRPLMLDFNNLELDGTTISTVIPPEKAFKTALEYLNALADLHMQHLLQQRNSVECEQEAESKFMNRFAFKNEVPNFINRSYDGGPFVLILGDLSPQNILVDDDGRITTILDLEWTSVRPVQCIGPPVWLSGVECGDVIVRNEDEVRRFQVQYDRFVEIFKRQETLFLQAGHRCAFQDPDMKLSRLMEVGLSTKNYWFMEAAGSFYGFDGLIPHAIADQEKHHDSLLLVLARWVAKQKLNVVEQARQIMSVP